MLFYRMISRSGAARYTSNLWTAPVRFATVCVALRKYAEKHIGSLREVEVSSSGFLNRLAVHGEFPYS